LGRCKNINSGVTPFATIGNGIIHNGDGVQTGNDLFNGNIASMVVNLPKLGDAKVYGFRYDQLNRLKAMNAYDGLNNSTNSFSAITLDDYMERLTYDANGNILSYIRNGFGAGIAMNDYSYTYEAGSNRLWELYNSAGGGHSYSYEYDEIGNVTLDSKQGVDAAEWNLYGKLKAVTKSGTDIEYSYDAGGQRISKKVNSTEEWYVKDATGNIMATYIKATLVNSGHLSTKEFNKYGSDLLGTEKLVIDVQTPLSPPEIVTFERGITDYLLNDHRGNNMSMVTDKKLQHSTDGATIDYYLADVRTASYYSAYGAISKSFNNGQIDLAYNGQRRSTEISANAQTADFWEYDGDVGRRWNIDPVIKFSEGAYTCYFSNPIYFADYDGRIGIPGYRVKKGDNLSKIAKRAGVTVEMILAQKGNEELRKNPSLIKPGQIIVIPPKAPTSQPVNTKRIVSERMQERTPGLDFMGKGALPLGPGGGKRNTKVVEDATDFGSNLAEHGEKIATELERRELADKFKSLGKVMGWATIIHHISTNDQDGLLKDGLELGISRTPLAPYYYGVKTFNQVVNSDYMQSAGYQALKAEFDEARQTSKSYSGSGIYDQKMRDFHISRANRAYNAMKEMEANWLKSHSTKAKSDN
jgi:LysM repeat protein